MKNKAIYILIGIVVAISGSLLAASTNLPYQFTAGGKAKAVEVNANFNTLNSALNGIDGRVTALEQSAPTRITVIQNDLPVGSTITIDGSPYTIVQFEVPRFDTDEIYLLKYPSPNNFTSGNSNESILVHNSGCSTDHNSLSPKEITSINGLDTLIIENFNFQNSLATDTAGRTIRSSSGHFLYTCVSLGPQTSVIFSILAPSASLQGSNPTRSADASGIITVYPPNKTSAQLNTESQNLHNLLSYVTIKKKL
ncbi:MAG: hypothetical protein A2511_14220 [Deltaproteobacteria bacterium RIFOXYD12_FULL_50_9]|nr:MAG: hypothetical protein A2511_14220 [Deltaproteobacteria bacterium RIFOXYD12_FULL_50_9]